MLKVWLSAFRPKTLTAAVVPVLVGSTLIYTSQFEVNWILTFSALMSALFIQIGTNLINDASDFKKGADTSERLGPTRVTQAGLIDYKKVWIGGFVCFALAVLFGLPLVISGGTTILLIGLVSLICGYAYTAGPFPLAYQGLGDLFVILFFGLVAVGGTYFLHSGSFQFSVVIAGLQVGLLCSVLIAINNLRDIDGDRLANKKTLPVRFGKNFARKEIAVLLLLPFLLNLYWVWKGYFLAGILPMIVMTMAIRLLKQINQTEPSREYNLFLAQAAKLHLWFGLLLSVGFLVT